MKRCLICEGEYISKFHPSQRAIVSRHLSDSAKENDPYPCEGKNAHRRIQKAMRDDREW